MPKGGHHVDHEFFFVLFGVAAMVALWELRRWALRWGTTLAERTGSWPGDELSPYATEISTRAVTIAAPLDTVWSWLVQIGQDRAGFYSYTWLENLFRCAMPRVDRIVPEWQQRTLGDIVWLARRDRYRGEARQKVVRIDRGRVLSLASPSDWGRLVQRETSRGRDVGPSSWFRSIHRPHGSLCDPVDPRRRPCWAACSG